MVVPGHERAELESVVAERDGWLVVRKQGEAATIAAKTDPRG